MLPYFSGGSGQPGLSNVQLGCLSYHFMAESLQSPNSCEEPGPSNPRLCDAGRMHISSKCDCRIYCRVSSNQKLKLEMSNPVGKKLYDAARGGRVSEVSSLLRDHPEINVNWRNPNLNRCTPLSAASLSGHVEVIKLLLAHPDMNVNVKDWKGQTPLHSVVKKAKCLLFRCC